MKQLAELCPTRIKQKDNVCLLRYQLSLVLPAPADLPLAADDRRAVEQLHREQVVCFTLQDFGHDVHLRQ